MRLSFLPLLFCFIALSTSRAQTVDDRCDMRLNDMRGKLICMNELHGVDANEVVYSHILNRIAAIAKAGDSITLILEIPYSLSYLYNQSFAGDTSIHIHEKSPLINTVRNLKLPVRIFGCDFEYDRGTRAAIYIQCLKHIAACFSKSGIDAGPLNAYIASLRKEDSWTRNPQREKTATFYERLADKYQGEQSGRIIELLFILSARHRFHAHRDPVIYRRLLEAERMGYISLHKFNLLIHGTAHINPQNSKNLYSYFLHRASSPFKDKAFIIGQAYIDCSGNNGYFSRNGEKIISSTSLFYINKLNKTLIDTLRNRYVSSLTPYSVRCFTDFPEVNMPAGYRQSILGWYVQYKTR